MFADPSLVANAGAGVLLVECCSESFNIYSKRRAAAKQSLDLGHVGAGEGVGGGTGKAVNRVVSEAVGEVVGERVDERPRGCPGSWQGSL